MFFVSMSLCQQTPAAAPWTVWTREGGKQCVRVCACHFFLVVQLMLNGGEVVRLWLRVHKRKMPKCVYSRAASTTLLIELSTGNYCPPSWLWLWSHWAVPVSPKTSEHVINSIDKFTSPVVVVVEKKNSANLIAGHCLPHVSVSFSFWRGSRQSGDLVWWWKCSTSALSCSLIYVHQHSVTLALCSSKFMNFAVVPVPVPSHILPPVRYGSFVNGTLG